jgi:hypothetical protein
MPLDWNAKDLKAAIRQRLLENAETVGKFVEEEARRRLLAITDPEWGQAYREKVVSRLLTNQVTATKDEIEILVGVAKSGKGEYHGFYIELGSSTAPAHPFLRPAVYENADRIVEMLTG